MSFQPFQRGHVDLTGDGPWSYRCTGDPNIYELRYEETVWAELDWHQTPEHSALRMQDIVHGLNHPVTPP